MFYYVRCNQAPNYFSFSEAVIIERLKAVSDYLHIKEQAHM